MKILFNTLSISQYQWIDYITTGITIIESPVVDMLMKREMKERITSILEIKTNHCMMMLNECQSDDGAVFYANEEDDLRLLLFNEDHRSSISKM